jgi:hypothetical protein
VTGAAGTLALVLAETFAGGAALLFLTPLWNEVKRGFFLLTGITLGLLALGTRGALVAAEVGSAPEAVDWAIRLTTIFGALTLIWLLLLWRRVRTPARVIGIVTVPVSIAVLVALAGTGEPSELVALFQLLAGAMFMGAVWDGLLLGHWYLTDRGLSRAPINRFAILLLVGVALEAVAVVAGGFGPGGESSSLNPLLTSIGLASWLGLGMVLVTALTAVMIRLTLRGERSSAVQSATGFFYLAVIFGFVGELAAKIRFLP